MKRKSILKALLLTVLMCCLTFALVACGGKHTVTFNYGVDGNGDGEVDVVTVEVGDGSLLEEPDNVPAREGYTFVGWGTDNGMWNFAEDTVTADITLNARWAAGDPVDPGTPGTTVYVNYKLGVGAADSDSDSDSDPSFVPNRWSGAPGTTIKLPPAPAAAAGWKFTGWLVTGETELRNPGDSYTVTGTVTITAQWKSVAYTQYTWTVEVQPDASNPGKAKGTPVVGDKDITVDLPMLPADESGYAGDPTEGMYNHVITKATCTESAKKTLYYTIPQTQTYESDYLQIKEQSLEEPATGHLYKVWTVMQQPSASTTGTARATCANGCGKTLIITLPAITGNTGSGEGKYTESEQQTLSCEKDGIVDYVYTIPASDLADGDAEDAATGTVKTVSFTVTTPATGHKIEIEVQLSDATETDTVTNASLIARCRNAGCDKEWDEDANPANATVTFNLGSGNIQSGGVTLTDADVKFDPETEQFTVTLPDKDAMTLTAGTIFTGWKVGDTPYAAGSTISVDADDPIAVTGNFTKHTHNYGEVTFVTSGENAGKFVATCGVGGCPEPTVVVASASDDDISVTLKNQVYLGGEIKVDDFTVTVTYKYQIAWGNDSVGDTHLTITLGDAADKTYQSYFSHNLNTLTTKYWAKGLNAEFVFAVGENDAFKVQGNCSVDLSIPETYAFAVNSGDVSYTGSLSKQDITNNDTNPAWNNGSTAPIELEGDFAAILTWENTRDVGFFDFFLEAYFNPDGIGQGGGQFIDLSADGAWAAEWVEVSAPAVGTIVGDVWKTAVQDANDTNAGAGTYTATVYRIGTSISMSVTQVRLDGSVRTRSVTFTNCPTTKMYLQIAGNPYFLDSIVGLSGTISAQN